MTTRVINTACIGTDSDAATIFMQHLAWKRFPTVIISLFICIVVEERHHLVVVGGPHAAQFDLRVQTSNTA